MADGSIIIDTRIDTGGVSKGMNAVKAGMTRISAQVSKISIVRKMLEGLRGLEKQRRTAI